MTPSESNHSGIGGSPRRVNILLVDDHPENLVALRAILTNPEYNLVSATSGAEALRHALRTEFALVLLDVLMPDMDGFEVAALLRQREPTATVPVIFLSAAGRDLNFIYKGYAVGAVDYLVKPIDADVVRAKVAVFVELYRKNRQIELQARLLQESEQRERALQIAEFTLRSEKRYRNLADSIPQIVWTAQPDGAVDHYNRRWMEYTGLSREECLSWGWMTAVHPDDARPSAERWRACVRTGDPYTVECRLRRADGTWRWHLCRALPERDRDGEIVAWLGTYTDIDDRRQIEQENIRLYREAQAAVHARDEFLSVASHELKTPLTSVKLHVRSLLRALEKSETRDEKVTARLETVDRQVDRLTRLINNLLDVSRITTGQIDLELEDVDLGEIVRHAVDSAREESERGNCPIVLHVDPGLIGRWDSLRIDQIVTNLISNAIKYGGAKPIEVRAEHSDRGARFTVRDQGIGIAPEDQARIFERYERAVTERQFSGLGLGLWIVRQIVEALGGEISVASCEGGGSVFTVELPRVRLSREMGAVASTEHETAVGGGSAAGGVSAVSSGER